MPPDHRWAFSFGDLHSVISEGVFKLFLGSNNGFLTPGAWPPASTVFGNTNDLFRNISDFGYYIFSSPVANLTLAQLQSRTAPLVQIAVLAAGAIQKVSIIVNVSL